PTVTPCCAMPKWNVGCANCPKRAIMPGVGRAIRHLVDLGARLVVLLKKERNAMRPKEIAKAAVGSVTPPEPRTGSDSPKLNENEFKRRFLSQFQDDAYKP